jgi:hypothetical protein
MNMLSSRSDFCCAISFSGIAGSKILFLLAELFAETVPDKIFRPTGVKCAAWGRSPSKQDSIRHFTQKNHLRMPMSQHFAEPRKRDLMNL